MSARNSHAMKTPAVQKAKPKPTKVVTKKRGGKYEEKLAVNLSFEELVAVSLAKPKTKANNQ